MTESKACEHLEWVPDGVQTLSEQRSGKWTTVVVPRVRCANPQCHKVELRPSDQSVMRLSVMDSPLSSSHWHHRSDSWLRVAGSLGFACALALLWTRFEAIQWTMEFAGRYLSRDGIVTAAGRALLANALVGSSICAAALGTLCIALASRQWRAIPDRARALPQEQMHAALEPDVPIVASARKQASWDTELLEYTHDAVIMWEMNGNGILYWNRSAEQLYGYSRQEAHGRITHELLQTRLAGGVSHLERAVARYGIWVGELKHTTRDGRQVQVEARLALMSQHGGRWLVLEVNRDITDRKAAEANRAAIERQMRGLREGQR